MSIGYHWETSPLNHIEYGPLKPFHFDEDSERIARALHARAERFQEKIEL